MMDLNERLKKTSDSKKGYGGFASATNRNEIRLNPENIPGWLVFNFFKIKINSEFIFILKKLENLKFLIFI